MGVINSISFPAANGEAMLEADWYLPTRRATNGAVIVASGLNESKETAPLSLICSQAADLGLTVLCFNSRFVTEKLIAANTEPEYNLNDLLGAYDFLQSFGKEIKPKRYYLVGQGLGGIAMLEATAQGGRLAGKINGLVLLGDKEKALTHLPGITCPVLIITANRAVQNLADTQTILENGLFPVKIEILKDFNNLDYAFSSEESAAHLQQVADITVKWLGEQDKIREDLRK